MARGWLTHLRESAIYKIEGVSDRQMRWQPTSTANSLGTLVRHLGLSERLWVRAIFAGEEMDMSWRATMFDQPPDDWTVNDVISFYRNETAAADRVLKDAKSFDLLSAGPMRPTTLRWVMFHLIEEVARHTGHMDITRELLDGQTGR